jgi:hypothetical protein
MRIERKSDHTKSIIYLVSEMKAFNNICKTSPRLEIFIMGRAIKLYI